MENKNYFYPDINDRITVSLIDEKEPFAGYWIKSEKATLNVIKKLIAEHSGNNKLQWLLDAGCGTGRLLPEFEGYFQHILAIDPDSSQIEKAKSLANKYGFLDKVVFDTISADKLHWKNETIDIILCSHVLQHVSTDSVSRILQNFFRVSKKKGLLFIMTTHSKENQDYYVKAYVKDSEMVEERIDKDEFDSLISNNKNILPLHFFSLKNITQIVENSGFSLLSFRSYHILGKIPLIDRVVGRDKLVNHCTFLKTRLGRDMLIICKVVK
jgi:ubiquinone/menaquinone biosynthesis C-methylase UbiE